MIGSWSSAERAQAAAVELGIEGMPEPLDPVAFLHEVSARGVGGIVDADSGFGWRSATRLTEINHDYPTALVAWDPKVTQSDGLVPVVRRAGASRAPATDFVPWERWDILDRAWLPFLGESPWLGYQPGERLWTVVADGSPIVVQGDGLLGPWFSADGTLLLATSPETLKVFIEHRYHGDIRVFGSAERLEVAPVDDLLAWLAADDPQKWMFSAVINPGMPRGMSAVIPTGSHLVISVAGEFAIKQGNVLDREEPPKWQNYGTPHYRGGPDRDLLPLDRSFCETPLGTHRDALRDLSDDETSEALEHLANQPATTYDAWAIDPNMLYLDDPFVVEMWDTAFGQTFVETYANLVDLVRWLKGYERESDRTARVSGFKFSFWDVGVSGSGDEVGEDLRSSLIQQTLDRWLAGVVKQGYQPADADRLTRIVNGLFSSLHVSVMGFLTDVTWRLQAHEDGLEGFCADESPIDLDLAQQWLAHVEVPRPNERFALEAERRISGAVWRVLQPNTQIFVTTGLADLHSRGNSPILDYAPVNLSLVKALETELNAVLNTFKSVEVDLVEPAGTVTDNDRLLLALLQDDRFPTIGQARHLLSRPDGVLQEKLHKHLRAIGAENLLTSKYREGLFKTVTRYRNGGVHHETVTLDDCRRAVSHLLDGDGKRPGLIEQTVRWRLTQPH